MKKNIEWLKKEFDGLFNGKTILTVGRSVVDEILDQLDEPETLSQKWINEKAVEVYADTADAEVHVVFRMQDLQNLIVPKREEITHKQVEKYLLDKNIRVIDIDIYEEMQSELEELKNGVTLSKTETVADVIADFFKSLERVKKVLGTEVEEREE